MANSCYSSLLLLSVNIFLHLVLVNCKPPLAPALYVFGDSLNDCGNNNHLHTNAKVNFKPYGVDFPYAKAASGRFTNGRTFADFIAQFLGLPLVPAYLGLTTASRAKITTGINFASGGGGILAETGIITGNVLSFAKQIGYFNITRRDLSKKFKTRPKLESYLAKSIFFVSIGSNDYLNNYLQPGHNSSRIYTPQKFADLLIDSLRKHLTILYKLGARKFVLYNVGRLGCVPAVVSATKPKPSTPCVEDINHMVMLYNSRLPRMLTALEHSLTGSTFVHGDNFNINKSSAETGFTTTQIPCCQTTNVTTGLCLPNSTTCRDRSKIVFWDAFHPTEVVNMHEAISCFNATSKCAPINFEQLAKKK
ncbi:hypothetical protein ACHQM5_006752 [Ranunculus cassubicifolius]